MNNTKLADYLAAVRGELIESGLTESDDKFFVDSIYKAVLICFNQCQDQAGKQGWSHALELCDLPDVEVGRFAAEELVSQWNQYLGTQLDKKLECAEVVVRNNDKELSPRAHNMIVEVLDGLRGGLQSNVA